MKKYNWLKLLCAGILFVSVNQSCTDLEEELFDQVTADNFFKTEEEFISALGAAYTSLGSFGGNANMYSLQEVTSDEVVVPTRGNDWNDGGEWRRLHTHTYNFEDPRIRDGWNFCFSGVNACNRLIFQFEGLEIDGKEAFLSELRVLRSLYYMWLLDTYGNVPIVEQFNVPDDFAPANGTDFQAGRQAVYEFVERSVLDNLENLSRAVDQSTYARVNYYVGQMILAKLYLNAEVYTGKPEWEKAVAACNEIINSGQYSLTGNYFDNFNAANEGSSEFIFVIPYDRVFLQGFNLPAMTLHYTSTQTYNLTFQPWNGFCSLEEFYNSYEDGDVRKGVPNTEEGPSGIRGNFLVGPQFSAGGERLVDSGAEPEDPDGPPLTFTPEINELQPRALRQSGARIGKFEFINGATQHLDNDFPVFRYADVLLMKAEALWRQNPSDPEALNLINQIRERADVDPFDSLDEDRLLAERGREMFSEVHRRTDLIRFGRYNDAWWEKPVSEPFRNVFPIPRSAIDANQNLTQNPGY